MKYRANGGSESNKEIIKTGSLAPGEVLVLGPSEATYAGAKTQVETNNPNVRYIEETWYFNGNDQIRLERGGVTTDYFGRDANSWPTYSGVESKNSNISRKAGVLTGRSSWWPMPDDTNSSNAISSDWVETVDFPSGYPTSSDLAAALVGVGVPPDNYIFDGTNWLSWDSSNNSTSTTAPSGSSTRPLYVATGTATLSNTGLSFPSVEVANGSTLNISAGVDVTISSSANALSYRPGDFVNNGTFVLNSDVNSYSSFRVEGSMTGSFTYRRWINDISSASPTNADPGWDLVGSPVSSATVNTTSLAQNSSNNNYAIQPYNNQTNSWTSTSDSTLALTDMVGYSMAMPEGSPGTIDFTGTLIKSHQTVTISNYVGSGSGTQWNLVSNPYPEFIALNSAAATASNASSNFLWYNGIQDGEDVLGHTDSEVAIYYWDGDEYNTGTQSDANLFAAPGSAFFVSSDTGTSHSLDFRTGMRVLGSDSGLASTNDWIGDINESENRAELFVEVSQNDFRAKTELFFLNNLNIDNFHRI